MKDEKMHFDKCGAQGDIKIILVPDGKIPKDFKKVKGEGQAVVTHSESGHHHVVNLDECELYEKPNESMVKYFVVKQDKGADIIHLKTGPDRHKTVNFGQGKKGSLFKIARQIQVTPDGLIKARED